MVSLAIATIRESKEMENSSTLDPASITTSPVMCMGAAGPAGAIA
jgi:hypothetical protein